MAPVAKFKKRNIMNRLQRNVVALGALILGATAAQAQTTTTTLVHYWNFNGIIAAYHNPSIPAIHASYSTLDTNKANVVYKLAAGASQTYAGYIDNVAGDTLNARMGAAAGNGLRVRNPSDSMELRVYAPTTGYYGNITIKYETQSSSTTSGQLAQLFDYSVDSGATWKTSGLNMTIDSVNQPQFQGTSWGLVSLNFNNDTTVRNNAKFVFRVRFGGNTSMTSGNNRFDNMTVESTVTSQGIAVLNGNDGQTVLYPNPAGAALHISTPVQGLKTIACYDLSGRKVYETTTGEKELTMNTDLLTPGTYYLYIVSGNHTDVKAFSKQ